MSTPSHTVTLAACWTSVKMPNLPVSAFVRRRSWMRQNMSDLHMNVKRIQDAQKLLINMWLRPPAARTHADTHAHTLLKLSATHRCSNPWLPLRAQAEFSAVGSCGLGWCVTLNSAKRRQIMFYDACVNSCCSHAAFSEWMINAKEDQRSSQYFL